MDRINEATIFAAEKHKGQKRKDGSEYINHPVKVATYLKDKGYGEDYILAALFHDLLEDTDATEDEIVAYSNPEVLEAVKLLTKRTEKSEECYIKDILSNEIARVVKAADRFDNLNDAFNGKAAFIKRYLDDTEKYYLGRFGEEVDQAYYRLKNRLQELNHLHK